MKEVVRYIAFDGAYFEYKEDAQYYEKIEILKKYRAQYLDIVCMCYKDLGVNLGRVHQLENLLRSINQRIRECGVEKDIIKARAERINLRYLIATARREHIDNKRMFRKYQSLHDKTDVNIRALEIEWSNLRLKRAMDLEIQEDLKNRVKDSKIVMECTGKPADPLFLAPVGHVKK